MNIIESICSINRTLYATRQYTQGTFMQVHQGIVGAFDSIHSLSSMLFFS
jgi:uncharacterized membrane protein YeaQ/YmgE (transglycosylase-associated protein family)